MIYTTGTIAGSGNTLTGTGTNFTAAGTLIRNGCTVIVLTSPPQAFQITGVTSATQLAVSPAVNPAIPAGTRYSILLSDSLSVDGLAQDIAETFGMYQRYMSGFADVMTGTGNVTITINGVAVTVPAQKSLAQRDESGGVPVGQGGTGSTTAAGARSNLGISDKQLDSVDGKTGGTISSDVILQSVNLTSPLFALKDKNGQINVNSNVDSTNSGNRRVYRVQGSDAKVFLEVDGAFRCRQGSAAIGANANNGFNLNWNSSNQVEIWIDSSNIGLINTTAVSDRLLKKDIEYIPEVDGAYEEVLKWKPATFKYIARGVITESDTKLGFIANDIIKASPECVSGRGLSEGFDPENPAGAYNLDQIAMIAKLTLAIQAQKNEIAEMKLVIEQLKTAADGEQNQ